MPGSKRSNNKFEWTEKMNTKKSEVRDKLFLRIYSAQAAAVSSEKKIGKSNDNTETTWCLSIHI